MRFLIGNWHYLVGGAVAMMERLNDNLVQIRERIAAAAERSGRDANEVRLLAVTKTHPAEIVRSALELGLTQFGENRVQELQTKAEAFAGQPISWSLIGHLQTNKAKRALEFADEFQALDSMRIAAALDRHCAAMGRELPVLIEVNTSAEESKSGLAPEQVLQFASGLAEFPRLRPRGLMTVAAPGGGTAAERCFAQLAELAAQLRERAILDLDWPELSMGMSGDFELAIKHGSTCIRLGTALFGRRNYPA